MLPAIKAACGIHAQQSCLRYTTWITASLHTGSGTNAVRTTPVSDRWDHLLVKSTHAMTDTYAYAMSLPQLLADGAAAAAGCCSEVCCQTAAAPRQPATAAVCHLAAAVAALASRQWMPADAHCTHTTQVHCCRLPLLPLSCTPAAAVALATTAAAAAAAASSQDAAVLPGIGRPHAPQVLRGSQSTPPATSRSAQHRNVHGRQL